MPRAASPRRVPPRSGRLRGPISSPVTIHWDRWGVAHVRAEASRDVFVGLGYAMAQERLWQPADSIAVWKYRWWRLTGRLDNVALAEAARRTLPPELEAAFMATELGEETIVPDAGSAAAAGQEGGERARAAATGSD